MYNRDNDHGNRNHDCQPCDCNAEGSESLQCDNHGQCTCKPNITGDKCDQSVPGYYNFPDPKGKFRFLLIYISYQK